MAINKVVKGDSTLIDVSDVGTTAANVAQGVTFIGNDGVKGVGTMSSGGGGVLEATTDAQMTEYLTANNTGKMVHFTGYSLLYKTGLYYIIDGVYGSVNRANGVGYHDINKKAYLTQYLTLRANPGWSLNFAENKFWDGTIEYSLDGINWTEAQYMQDEEQNPQPLNIYGEGIVYFRGTGNTVLYDTANQVGFWDIGGDSSTCFEVYGNIESLLDYQTAFSGQECEKSDACFKYLFSNMAGFNVGIINAENLMLPANTLVPNCYQGMFFQNQMFTFNPPDLYAQNLASYCYSDMFAASSVKNSPKLPATVLAQRCYGSMFKDSLITEATDLPAATTEQNCYSYMFGGCNNLIKVHPIRSTTLASNACSQMYSNCSNLQQLPAIYSTSFAMWACNMMFSGCTYIEVNEESDADHSNAYRVPVSGEGTNTGSNPTRNMFGSTYGNVTVPALNTTYYTNATVVTT